MPKFRDIRQAVLLAHTQELIGVEEFVLLYDTVKSRNRDLPYWNYEPFGLDELSDDECQEEFRFLKNDIYLLHEMLGIPDDIVCYNGTSVDGIEAFCAYLKRFAYPCRYSDMISRFGRSVQELCLVSNHIMNFIYDNHHHRLTQLNQTWLSPIKLQDYCNVIHNAGAALANCWGFVDGTVRPVCRPGQHQRILYNGHKKVHSIKFQSVVTPNGLIANLFGPVEGRRHDSGMLAQSNLLQGLRRYSVSPTGQDLCIYGDPAYPLRINLQGPFKGAAITNAEKAYNKSMSEVRISVEWVFADIVNYFAFLDFKKKHKVGLSAVGKMYATCALLHNARTCLYGNVTSKYFNLEPPGINEYFQ